MRLLTHNFLQSNVKGCVFLVHVRECAEVAFFFVPNLTWWPPTRRILAVALIRQKSPCLGTRCHSQTQRSIVYISSNLFSTTLHWLHPQDGKRLPTKHWSNHNQIRRIASWQRVSTQLIAKSKLQCTSRRSQTNESTLRRTLARTTRNNGCIKYRTKSKLGWWHNCQST